MTVKELIEKLKEFPEDMNVEYSDYEMGYTEINVVERHPTGKETYDVGAYYRKNPVVLLS